MAVTQDIIVKYKADITDLQAKVNVIEGNLRKAEKSLGDFQKSTNTNIGKTTSGVEGLKKAILPIGGLIAAAFTTGAIIAFGKESIRAFQEAELSARKLQTAVSANGGLQADYEELLKQSSELQKTTIFSDETIQGAQTMALQFGLTSDTVEELIPLITDFASATGQDLNSALSAVLRGVEGSGRALKLYGVQVDSNATRSERFASITEQLTKKFNGQAEAVGKTSLGSIQRLSNAYDDLKEKVGAFLVPAVEGFVNLANAAVKFTEVPISVELQKEKTAFEAVQTELSGLNVGSERRVELIKKLQQQYPEYLGNIDAETVSNEQLNAALSKVNNSLIVKIALQKQDEAIQEQQVKQGEALAKLEESRAELVKELSTIRNRANAEQVKALLDGLPIEAQANELIQGRIKLNGIAAVSLGNLSDAFDDFKEASIEFNSETIKTDDLLKKRIDSEKNLTQLLGVEVDKRTDKKVTGLEKETEEERKRRETAEKQAAEAREKQAKVEQESREALRKFALKSLQDNITDEDTALKARAVRTTANQERLAEKQLAIDLITLNKRKALLVEFGESVTEIEAQIQQKEAEVSQAALEQNAKFLDDTLKDIEDFYKEKADIKARVKDNPATLINEEIQAQKDIFDIRKKSIDDQITLLITLNQLGIETGEDFNKEIKRLAEERKKINKDEADFEAKTEGEIWVSRIEVAQQGFEILSSLYSGLATATLDSRISALQLEQEALQEQFDAEQEAIEQKVQRRQITEAQGEKQLAELDKKRVASQKAAEAEERKLRQKQADQEKLLKIFEITLELLLAIAKADVFQAAAAGAALAVAVATPVPKFKHGTPWLERGKNPPGDDTIPIYANEGERIVPTDQNLKHWDLYEAIDAGRVNEYVMRHYFVPVLKEQKQKHERQEQDRFAGSIAAGLDISNLFNRHDADYQRRKGVKFANGEAKKLAKEIGQEVSKEVVRQLIYQR